MVAPHITFIDARCICIPRSRTVVYTILVSVAAFASTNIDDIFVLLGFFSAPAFRTRHVVLGQYLGIGALVAVSLVCSPRMEA
jgi:cadmium resistance protein CadD (predicted permease)